MKQRMRLATRFCAMFYLLAAMFSFLAWTSAARAQETPLPPGTSTADSAAALSGKQSSLLGQAEDAIERVKMPEAMQLLNAALALEPKNARGLYDRGYVEERTQQPDLAAADFQKAIDANPNLYEAHAALGRLDASQGKFDEARQQLEAATRLTPGSGNAAATKAEAFRLLARVDNKLQDPEAASDALLAALKLSPEQPEDTLLTAQLTAEEGDPLGAAMEFRKALASAPAGSEAAEEARIGLVQALMAQKKLSDAEPILRRALAQDPDNEGLQAQLATVLAAEGKKDDALAELTALHQKHPEEPAVTRMLADLETQSGEAQQADPLYLQLLAKGKPDASLLTARGENLIQQRRFPAAVAVLKQAAELEPGRADTWSNLAFAASQTWQYALVLQALDQRKKAAPDSAEAPAATFLRATALDHLLRTKEAIAEYQKFIATANTEATQGKFAEEVAQVKQRLAELARQQKRQGRQSQGKDN